jgi:multidrug efflux pump subunit AcrA (membrane-fusion protein)
LKQLELEEKSLKLNREISKLNLQLASIAESMMYPTAPCTGTVERVFVNFGQMVNPGTPLAMVTCTETSAVIVAQVSRQLAATISRLEKATVNIDGQLYNLDLNYISSEATNGQTFAVIYDIPKDAVSAFTNQESISLAVPIGAIRTSGTLPYVPLDALYQTEVDAYVFVIEKQADSDTYLAKSHTVTVGGVYGDFVEVTSGLTTADQVIVDRTVIDGDTVQFTP